MRKAAKLSHDLFEAGKQRARDGGRLAEGGRSRGRVRIAMFLR